MFKKDISPGSKSKVKSSVQRAIRTQLVQTYPLLAPHIDEIIPKKEQLDAMKIPERVTLYLIGPTPLFYQHMTDALLPHLKLVHRFPTCFPSIRIDRGAIRFVLSGATLMAPGLTSTGGRLPSGNSEEKGGYGELGGKGEEGKLYWKGDEDDDEREDGKEGWYGGRELEKGEPVVVCAEGKREACAVGLLSMGTKECKEKGKGPVVEEGHYLGDGLWRLVTE
ncbi:probable translation machinery-associated protein 20 [Phialocephala subalpina]|uniref:Translation machinery-associated protein 20 n=1 Tax=Phialocephala subalpina TaxID=576137 RepID=A0A1L7XA76_9HELO|nr:probable translation machinery-associated protein 20 [Phialocephala subalpina]